MKPIVLVIHVVLMLFCSACSTLNIAEINNLEKESFQSLMLKPDAEPGSLRIDLLRQTETQMINDSTIVTEELPYHPMGFNLGNDLFYDLNNNLSIRLDLLLNFSGTKEFELQYIPRPGKNKGRINYLFRNDSMMVSYPPRQKKHYRYQQISNADSTAYRYKNRLSYAIVKTDSSLIYRGKRRKWKEIIQLDTNRFCLSKKRRRDTYEIKDGQIRLDNDYLISLSNDAKTLEIRKQGRRKSYILYSMVKSADKLFIFNRNYIGKKIEYTDRDLKIYYGKKIFTEYRLILPDSEKN